MSIEEKAKAYDEAMNKIKPLYEQAKKDGNPIWSTYEFLFPELREEEKPLTPFQQCLNCILRGVYYAEVPDKKVNEFILNVVRTRTDELIKLAKRHEYTDCQLRESEEEQSYKRIEQLIRLNTSGAEKTHLLAYLEKQKDSLHISETCKENADSFTDEQKEQKPVEWSEEDEKILDSLIRLYSIEYSEYVCPWANGTFTYGDVVNFLKSLRPQPKHCWEQMEWTDTDLEEFTENVRHIITDKLTTISKNASGCEISSTVSIDDKTAREIANAIIFCIGPQPHWKPSEEQMRGLKFFLDFHRSQRNAGTTNWREYDAVESLYEQLKKL